MFHPNTIEEVKQRVDIVDIISDYVVLKKRGSNYQGLCPFHDEKSPSFSVNPSKQFYHCFGCGAGGNGIKFLMEINKQSFPEVILDLAKRYQVPIKTLEPEQKQELQKQLTEKEQLYEIVAIANSFFQHTLKQKEGKIALDYLKEKRKLEEENIQKFEFGYAPAGWETLYHYLIEQKRYSVELAQKAGLIKPRKSGHGYYDYFRDRLMIPIHDIQGRVIAFGSRTLTNEEPKYLNSPDTPLFDKGKTLFPLDKAKNSMIKKDQVIIVEGYFDAIALHIAGINQSVASLGTALSENQIKSLLRYTESKQIIFNFDADQAGINATKRAINEIEKLIYSGQINLRILNLPGGKDADEFLKSNPYAVENYQTALEKAPLWLDWEINQLIENKDLKQADQFQKVVLEMINILNKLENPSQRTYYIRYCAELLSQGDYRLIPLYTENINKQLKKPHFKSSVKNNPMEGESFSPQEEENKLLENAENILLLIYLHCPEYREEIVNKLDEKDLLFTLSNSRFLWQKINQIEQEINLNDNDNENQLYSALQEHLMAFPEQFSRLNHLFYLNEHRTEDLNRIDLMIRSAIATLERVMSEKYRHYCLEKWKSLDPHKDDTKFKYYLKEFYQAQARIKELDNQRQLNYLEIFTPS
jgi:DNA primase